MAPPTTALAGAVEVTVMELAFLTVKLCCTWVAAFQFVLPESLKCRVHVPAAMKLTTPEEMVQTVVVAEVMTTVSPEVAVAVGV